MTPSEKSGIKNNEEDAGKLFPEPEPEPKYIPCDKKSTLYISNDTKIMEYNTEINSNYSDPFHIKKIPKSNLFMVVIKFERSTQDRKPPLAPERIFYDVDFPCYKKEMCKLPRRRLEECFVQHVNVIRLSFYCSNTHINFNCICRKVIILIAETLSLLKPL